MPPDPLFALGRLPNVGQLQVPQLITGLIPSAPARAEVDGVGSASTACPRALASPGLWPRGPLALAPPRTVSAPSIAF